MRGLRAFYVVALMVTVIPNGAILDQVSSVALLLFAALAITSALMAVRRELVGPMAGVAILFAVISGAALMQMVPLGLAHESWREAAEIIGPLPGVASVYPMVTLLSLGDFILPILAFMTCLALFQDDKACESLMWWLAILGLLGAVVGLYEFFVSPDTTLLFLRRPWPSGGVSAFFLNKNLGAPFLGMSAVIWSALLVRRLQEVGLRGVTSILLENDPRHRSKAIALAGFVLGLLCVLIALFLTTSRAGIFSSLAGMFIVFVSMAGSRHSDGAVRWRLLGAAAASCAVVVALTSFLGSQLLNRISNTDPSQDGRWCAYESILSAIRDYPLTGTGFGAFPHAFPHYRAADCFPFEVYFNAGHSVYLELAMGLGVWSLLPALAAMAALCAVLVRGVRTRRRLKFAPAAGLGIFAVAALHSILDFSVQIPGVGVFAAAALAAAVVVSLPPGAGKARARRRRKSRRTEEALA